MTDKPLARRGLGRGLGSLIPTGPRVVEQPEQSGAAREAPAPDWIGIPQPGDSPTTAGSGAAGTSDAGGSAGPDDTSRPGDTSPEPQPAEAAVEPHDPAGGPAGGAAGDAAGPHDAGSNGAAIAPVAGAFFAELPVAEIRRNPRQPREVFDEDAMAELVHSVREVGLLQPVVVRPLADGGYELVMGERRWRACREAGLASVPAIVRETGDDDLLRDALLENLHRVQLNALEEAAAYQQLLEDFGCTHEELASRIGRSRPQISNTIRLLRLSPAVQRRVAAGVLSAGHARALLAVDDPGAQDRLASRVVAEGISVRGLEELVAVGDHAEPASPTVRRNRPTAPGLDDLSARLSDRLDTRVKVELGRRKGRISVEFASLPDLERIVALIDPPGDTQSTSGET